MKKKCVSCGADVATLVCHYCGALTRNPESTDSERSALDEFHRVLQQQDEERRATLLRSGFMPGHLGNVIEAGIRCVPLADATSTTSDVAIAAVARLEGIITKLKVVGGGQADTKRAIAEFEKVVAKFRHADRKLGMSVLIALVILVGGAIGGVYLIYRMLR